MRVCLPRKAFGVLGVLVLAGCSSGAPSGTEAATTTTPPREAGLAEVTVQIPEDMAAEPFDEPRKALVPNGWTLSV